MISARGLAKRYGERRVFAGVDLDLAAGGFLLVTGPNGSGKTTLLRVLAGLAAPTSGELQLPERQTVGYLGHDPLVYRELSPLENLTLFGRLYRIPERGERIGMLLERFGLWEVRHERVSTFSRGMQQRLGLCRVLLHDPSLLLLDEPYNALDAQGAELLDGILDEPRTLDRRDARAATRRASSDRAVGLRMTYVADVGALARKDLLLELRAKETLPSMLLFVVAALTIFHFALPHGTSHAAALGLLWAALIFTALLGLTRAFVPEREQGMFDALVLAPCDRSAIWLGKALAVLAFLVAAEVVALPAFAAFFSGIDGRTVAAVALADIGIAAVGTLFGAMAVAGRARELLLPVLFLPMAIPIVVGGVGGYLWFLVLYDAIFVLLSWAAFEYVVSET